MVKQIDAVKIVQDVKKVRIPVGAHPTRAYALPPLQSSEGEVPITPAVEPSVVNPVSSITKIFGGLAGVGSTEVRGSDLTAGVVGAGALPTPKDQVRLSRMLANSEAHKANF